MADPKRSVRKNNQGAKRLRRPQTPNDIVIHRDGAGGYVIVKAEGERIGTADDRLEAMRRGWLAARATGANVWMRVDRAT
jgi:hypothetical protein